MDLSPAQVPADALPWPSLSIYISFCCSQSGRRAAGCLPMKQIAETKEGNRCDAFSIHLSVIRPPRTRGRTKPPHSFRSPVYELTVADRRDRGGGGCAGHAPGAPHHAGSDHRARVLVPATLASVIRLRDLAYLSPSRTSPNIEPR